MTCDRDTWWLVTFTHKFSSVTINAVSETRRIPVFTPRDHSRQHTGEMAKSRMGDVEACLDQELED